MSASGLDNTITRTPDQARADIARKERERWYPGRDTAGGAIILSAVTGRSIALVGTEADRDFLVLAAQSFHAMRAALETILDAIENYGGTDMVVKPVKEDFGRQCLMSEVIRDALARARKDKP